MIEWDINFKVLKTFLTITLGVKITFVGPSHVSPAWGQNRFIYQAANDWNILANEVKNISDILCFKRHIRSIL